MERSCSRALGAAALCTLAVPALSSDLQEACNKLGEAALEPLLSRRPSQRGSAIAMATATAAADQQPEQLRRPVSVVVGAGPAGILTAVVLARRGHEVHVYDRRPSPLKPTSQSSGEDNRAFVIGLNERGRAALEAAGFDVSAFAGPNSGLQPVSTLALSLPGGAATAAPSTRQLLFNKPWLVGPRQAHCAAMLAQAQAMHPAAISWHWGVTFEDADLAARTATFATCPGEGGSGASSQADERHTRSYDLLVAADGGWSRVRRAAVSQVPALAATTVEPSPVRYKVFRGLPPSASLPVGPSAAGPAGSGDACCGEGSPEAAAAGGGKETPQLRLIFASGRGLPQPGALFLTADPAVGSVRGILSMADACWEAAGLDRSTCAGAHAAFLARRFPTLPPEWLLPMATQLAEHPLWTAGARVHAPQLHGPGLLLVGDAGHGVTPRTGNGMNAAMQDAAVIDQLLAESGDLASLPQRFTAARLEDAHALLWLDGTTRERGGTSRWGLAHPLALSNVVSTLVRSVLTKATGGWVAPPALVTQQRGTMSYSALKRQIQRDAALCAVLAAGSVAALAAACLRRR
ncbi:hypothetical protein ABPG75_009239 [Micractinium tetrahymenae]